MPQNIKQKIRTELKNPDFPNLEFLYSTEVLDAAPELLDELLEEEKKDFEEKIGKKYIGLDEQPLSFSKGENLREDSKDRENMYEITFDIFDDFSELDYFFGMLEHLSGVRSDETIRKIIEDFEPKYIEFANEVAYNQRFYEMHTYFYEKLLHALSLENGEDSGESGENIRQQKRILEETIKAYKIRGINLGESDQSRLKKISRRLSELSQKFSNNVLDDRAQFEYVIDDERIISEMPEDDRDLAKSKADKKNISGFLFDASASSYIAIMKYCSKPEIRKHFYETRISFASSGEYDNRDIIVEILNLRQEKAQILGYANYAELSFAFKMAKSPEEIISLFEDISQKAQPKAKKELEEIRAYFGLSDIYAWDSSYYSRKLKEEKYALDDAELKKYFVFENILSGMFQIVKKLYNIEMKEISASLYDENVQVYEVYKDGKFLSYFFTDYFYNPLKRQGAWANILREKVSFGSGSKYAKIVLNVCNFQKNSAGVTLLTLDEVETMFHEFGHAIHEMLSWSQYPELSGMHVEWDFVELPSQLLENWARDEAGMKLFARHFQTGEEIPKEMLKKLDELETFGNGNFVLKQNEYTMLDMKLHSSRVPQDREELQKISDEIYQQNALFPLIENYHMYASFSHIFDGGYAAGYYSYLWAEIIEKEVWKIFKDSGDIFSSEIAEKFYLTILGAGSTKKASELFRDFAGRDPEIDAFLGEKGLK